MKREVFEIILEKFPDGEELLDYLDKQGLITHEGIREFLCYQRLMQYMNEGCSMSVAILELEADGRKGPALGASYSTIWRMVKRMEARMSPQKSSAT
jgi:hypothetical protein